MQSTEKINQTSQNSISPFAFTQIYIPAIECIVSLLEYLGTTNSISQFAFTQIYIPAIECIVSLLENLGTTIREYAQVDSLNPEHIEHLYNEGFSFSQIALWVKQGLRSLTQEQADQAGFKVKDGNDEWVSGSGLYFPFKGNFGQLRLDIPIERKKGSTAKYLTPLGAKTQARIPSGCKVVTEGAKDAVAGSLRGGIPTSAIAGISHYRKALKQDAGYTVLFDADGWTNPAVFSNLFHAGKWLNGKVQLIPEIEGYPKAGLCEYFKVGNTTEDYKQLVASAKKPEALLLQWGKHFGDIPEVRLSQAVRIALRLAAEYLDDIEQDVLVSHIKTACDKVSGKTLTKELKKQKAIVEARKQKQAAELLKQNAAVGQQQEPQKDEHPEAFYRGICQTEGLNFDNCVTAQTFDGWVYRNEFGATEGDWRVIDSAFYQWRDHLGYWQHQPDSRLNSLIAESGEKAFKLKYSKEFGWQVVKPYETNSYKESAFKYCRSRLERPEPLPVNNHLRAFNNCVVDLRTGARMPHDKEYYLTSQIPYDYEPGKDCPEAFRQFVADSFGEDMLPIVRAFTSMFLDPTAPYGRFPHLIGQSGGGKGTLGRFWNSLFGEDGASSGDFSNIATAEGRHQYLTGKALFSIPDAGGYVCGLRAFYELVDNGGMSGRALFNPVGYFKTWNTRFWIASVDHLQIENAGDGWARRAYPIPVRARTVKPDPDLRLKLESCKADVVSWALAMPREERDRILLSPPTNERIINLSLDSALYGDSTKSFVDLCLRPSANASFVPHHLLHTWYVAYCKEHGYTPMGMSKFISHLKTVLPRNFADRTWTPMVNGQRSKVPAHWEFLVPVNGAFVKGDRPMTQGGTFSPPQPIENQVWTCIKSQCEEGGLMEFEDFWNPPQPPDEGGDNNGNDNPTPSDLPPSGTGGTGWYKKSSIAETTQNQGGQGGTGVQGIALAMEKNTNFVLEELPAEKIVTDALTGVSRGGQSECRVDSGTSTQDIPNYEDYPHLTCNTLEAKRNQAEDIKERLLTANTKQELTLIREQYSSRCDWVWKNLLTEAQRQSLKDMAAIEQLSVFAVEPAAETDELLKTEVSESAAQCDLPLYQRADGQIEVDQLAIGSAVSLEPTGQGDLSEWLNPEELENMARDLNNCEDADTLALLRESWNPEAMNAACKLLSAEKHAEIKEWVIQLNALCRQNTNNLST